MSCEHVRVGLWSDEMASVLNAFSADTESASQTCEQILLAELQEDMTFLALQAADRLLIRGKNYINCRLGVDTPAARSAANELTRIIQECVLANLPSLLWQRNIGRFLSNVIACLIDKLRELVPGDGGGGGGDNGGGGGGGDNGGGGDDDATVPLVDFGSITGCS